MEIVSFPETLHRNFRALLRECSFIKPAVVEKVYDFTVDVRPLTTTKFSDGVQLKSEVCYDVPMFIYSTNKGKARVTVPVKKGDTVLLLFSDRDFGTLLDNSVDVDSVFPGQSIDPCSGHPIMAFPCFYTNPEGSPIDKDNIVVENGSTKITIKEDGDIDLETTKDVNVSAGGNVRAVAGGNAEVVAPGQVTITSPLVACSGVVTAQQFVASTSIITPSLQQTDGGPGFFQHIHPENDQGGPTGPPIGFS